VFLPNYTYEAHSVRRWTETGLLLQRLQRRVEGEPKNSQEVELALETYSRDAKSNGAFLLSVIGGKTSDGINFSNEMAPCVMVVGLPYPDITVVKRRGTSPSTRKKRKTGTHVEC
jgi:chromosome transmission fidelity protein 1